MYFFQHAVGQVDDLAHVLVQVDSLLLKLGLLCLIELLSELSVLSDLFLCDHVLQHLFRDMALQLAGVLLPLTGQLILSESIELLLLLFLSDCFGGRVDFTNDSRIQRDCFFGKLIRTPFREDA
jgi:hypothetical protein